MKTPSLLFTLVLLAAGSGLAQPQSPLTPPPLPSEASPSSALASQPEEKELEERGLFRRTAIGALGGMGGGLVGAGVGALTGYGLARWRDPDGCASEAQRTCSGGRLAGVLIGAAVGVPAGTYLARAMTGGQGLYVSALFGNLLAGLVAGVGISAAVDFTNNDSLSESLADGAIMGGLLMLPVLGSALLYERSHAQALGKSLRPTSLRYSAGARVSLEVLYGLVGGLMGGTVGFVGGFVAGDCEFPDGCYTSKEQVIADSTFVLGAVLGSSLGVYAAGRQTQGRVSFFPVLVGSSLGAATGALGFTQDKDAGVPLMLLGSLVGAIIGHEVAHAFTPPPPPEAPLARRSPVDLQVMPVVSATPAGGLFGGLAGTF